MIPKIGPRSWIDLTRVIAVQDWRDDPDNPSIQIKTTTDTQWSQINDPTEADDFMTAWERYTSSINDLYQN